MNNMDQSKLRPRSTRVYLRQRHLELCCGAAILGLLSCDPAFAQTADTPAPATSSGPQIEEIVVTAQRREEKLENVPMAVIALNGSAIERRGVNTLLDLGQLTPGVQVGMGGGFTSPSVRGVTVINNSIGIESNVATYIDGFYTPDMLTLNTDLANIASIEVLKGPQGTLYGRNATGGAILINTLAPSKTTTGKFDVSYGRFNEASMSGYFSGPLSDRVRFSIAGALRDSDGYIDLAAKPLAGTLGGDAARIRQRSVRTKLEADLTDTLTATLAYNFAYANDPRGVLFTTFDHQPPTYPNANFRATDYGTASYNYKSSNRGRTNEGTLKLAWQTGLGTLTSYSGIAKRSYKTQYDFDGTYVDQTSSIVAAQQRTIQQTLDFAVTAIDHVDLVLGASYYNDRYTQPAGEGTVNYLPGRIPASQSRVGIGTNAIAVYADATVHLTDSLSLNAGGRYNAEKKFTDAIGFNGAGAVTFPLTHRSVRFNRFTPRASIRFELAPRTNIYASYSKGFRSGTFNAALAAAPALVIPTKPEDIQAYEVGFKTAGRIIRFETAGFHYDYKNLNIALTVPDPRCTGPSCPPISILGNAPKAKIYGIDAQVTITPIEKLNITAGGAWVHARYGAFPNATGVGLNSVTNRNVTGQVQDWTGQQLPRAPTFSGNIGVDYSFAMGAGEMALTGNVNYSDSFVISNPSLYGPLAVASLQNKQRYRQAPTTLVNLRATWTDPSGHYKFGVYGKNVTDRKYRLTYNGGAFGDYSTPNTPATYGVSLGYEF